MTVFSRFALVAGRSMPLLRSIASSGRSSLVASASRQYLNAVRCASSSVNSELVDALENEIQAEKRLESDNLGGSTRPTISGFEISTNQSEVRLKKTYNNENILVVFSVNHSVDVEEEEGNTDSAPLPIALPPFSIEITKGSERLCFNMTLVETGEDGQFDFRVDEFYIAEAVKSGNEDVPDEVYASSGRYIDPELHEILFVRYLEERGFTQEFCRELAEYATHFEHDQYVNLLAKIKTFVSRQ